MLANQAKIESVAKTQVIPGHVPVTQPPASETKLDPRVVRTRKILEEAFLSLLREKGLRGLTVQDITERAQVNRATFYAHFEDKYALFSYITERQFRESLDARVPASPQFSPDTLRQIALGVCDFLSTIDGSDCSSTNHQEFHLMVEAQIQQQIYARVLALIQAEPQHRWRATPK